MVVFFSFFLSLFSFDRGICPETQRKKEKKRSMRKLNGVGVTIQWIIMMGRGDLAGFW